MILESFSNLVDSMICEKHQIPTGSGWQWPCSLPPVIPSQCWAREELNLGMALFGKEGVGTCEEGSALLATTHTAGPGPALPSTSYLQDKPLPVFSRVWWAQTTPVAHGECWNTAQSLTGSCIGQPAQRRALIAPWESCRQVMSCKNEPRKLGSQGREGFLLHYIFKWDYIHNHMLEKLCHKWT